MAGNEDGVAGQSTRPRLMLVADSQESVDRIIEALENNDMQLFATLDEPAAIGYFVRQHPPLLIMSYEAVERAERLYLMLLKATAGLQTGHYQTLLLCHEKDSEIAYQLCATRVFDDYLVDRPLLDAYRLRLTVRQALERHSLVCRSEETQDQSSREWETTRALLSSVSKALENSDAVREEAGTAVRNLSESVAHLVRDYPDRLSTREFQGVVAVHDRDALTTRTEAYYQQQLAPELAAAERHITRSMERWTGELKQAQARHMKDVTELERAHVERPRSILVVDDDPVYRDILREVLEGAGHRVYMAANGFEAMGLMRGTVLDLVFVDLEMPKLDGLELIRRTRQETGGRDIPVIMLTAHRKRTVVEEAIQAGATDYVVKPASKEVLLDKLATHLR